MKPYRVLFVCLGNICRSPLAKGIFLNLLEEQGLSERVIVDSCGTGSWHTGSGAHSETVKAAKQIGVSLEGHSARKILGRDFIDFDLIVAMDRRNHRDICALGKPAPGQLILLRSLDPQAEDLDVPDPFEGGPDGFLITQEIIRRGCVELLGIVAKRIDV